MVFDFSRYLLWPIDGAVTLNEADSTMTTNGDGVNRLNIKVRALNPDYTVATVIMVEGFRFPVCARSLGDKWEPCMGLRLNGEDLTAEEFMLKDKMTRLGHYGKSDEE